MDRKLYTYQGYDICCDRDGDGGIVIEIFPHADNSRCILHMGLAKATFRQAWRAGVDWLIDHEKAVA